MFESFQIARVMGRSFRSVGAGKEHQATKMVRSETKAKRYTAVNTFFPINFGMHFTILLPYCHTRWQPLPLF